MDFELEFYDYYSKDALDTIVDSYDIYYSLLVSSELFINDKLKKYQKNSILKYEKQIHKNHRKVCKSKIS